MTEFIREKFNCGESSCRNPGARLLSWIWEWRTRWLFLVSNEPSDSSRTFSFSKIGYAWDASWHRWVSPNVAKHGLTPDDVNSSPLLIRLVTWLENNEHSFLATWLGPFADKEYPEKKCDQVARSRRAWSITQTWGTTISLGSFLHRLEFAGMTCPVECTARHSIQPAIDWIVKFFLLHNQADALIFLVDSFTYITRLNTWENTEERSIGRDTWTSPWVGTVGAIVTFQCITPRTSWEKSPKEKQAHERRKRSQLMSLDARANSVLLVSIETDDRSVGIDWQWTLCCSRMSLQFKTHRRRVLTSANERTSSFGMQWKKGVCLLFLFHSDMYVCFIVKKEAEEEERKKTKGINVIYKKMHTHSNSWPTSKQSAEYSNKNDIYNHRIGKRERERLSDSNMIWVGKRKER